MAVYDNQGSLVFLGTLKQWLLEVND